MAAEQLFVDTNVLLSVMDRGRAKHADAVRLVNEAPAGGVTLFTSGQILRELLVVATRPLEVNGLGLTLPNALRSAEAFARRMTPLAEDRVVAQRLRGLIEEIPCLGKQIHDANLVATMLAHGVRGLVTCNPSHFERFESLVRIVGL